MEEIIEQLREANEPVPVPLELPDEDQLVEIEEQLFIDIPFVFREFLLTVSDVVYGSLEPVTVTDPQSHTYLPDVAANAWDAGVDRSMIPICQDGDDYYCVEEDGTVVLWSGEEELVDRRNLGIGMALGAGRLAGKLNPTPQPLVLRRILVVVQGLQQGNLHPRMHADEPPPEHGRHRCRDHSDEYQQLVGRQNTGRQGCQEQEDHQ